MICIRFITYNVAFSISFDKHKSKNLLKRLCMFTVNAISDYNSTSFYNLVDGQTKFNSFSNLGSVKDYQLWYNFPYYIMAFDKSKRDLIKFY